MPVFIIVLKYAYGILTPAEQKRKALITNSTTLHGSISRKLRATPHNSDGADAPADFSSV